MAPEILPFKIQDVHRRQRFGLVVKNLSDLLAKARQKLQVDAKLAKTLRVCLEEDGTEILDDAFLMTLPAQTALVILQPGEFWMGNLSYVMTAFEHVKKISPLYQVKERIEQTMDIEKDLEKMSLISMLLATLDNKRHVDDYDQDPDWFKDLPKTAKSKEKVLEASGKSRVRSYFYDARRAVKVTVTPAEYEKFFASIFDAFSAALKEHDYYGGYFCRSASDKIRLCDTAGWFNCEGPFDMDVCPVRHLINPYDNKESRIIFSTWNLDHQIEKSRQVVPALITAVSTVPTKKVLNWEYFYGLLFTRANLRLVHIACHKKCEHTTKKVNGAAVHVERITSKATANVLVVSATNWPTVQSVKQVTRKRAAEATGRRTSRRFSEI